MRSPGSSRRAPPTCGYRWEFSGLLVVPDVPGIYQDQLTIASAVDIVRQLEAISEAIGFPLQSVPHLDPRGYVINEWHEEMLVAEDPDAPVWRRSPDIAFYVAVFWAAARYCVANNDAVAYS